MVVNIANSTFADNSARAGGAMTIHVGNTVSIEQTTITNNVATNADSTTSHLAGGGIYFQDLYTSSTKSIPHGPLTLSGVILSGNRSSVGAADLSTGTSTQGSATVTSTGSFLGVLDPGISLTGSGNLRGNDPLLGPLRNNGGRTFTMLPLPGSPVIDAGPSPVAAFTGNEFDQRGPGFPRVVGTRADVGAVEWAPPVGPTPTTAPEPAPAPVDPTATESDPVAPAFTG